MSDLPHTLSTRVLDAAAHALGPHVGVADAMLRPSNDPKFGDYQANLALPLAKQLKQKPRDLAERIAAALGDADGLLAQPAEVAGPGFINLTLADAKLRQAAAGLADDPRLGVPEADPAAHVVVDYASPNLAKEMHVGHLRSTIIGDAVTRTLDALGHRVTRQNHIGDWGTQFGMLLEHLIETGWSPETSGGIGDLNALYQEAKKRDDADPAFAERARQRVVALQAGDDASLALWRKLIDESVRHMNQAFDRLGVLLTDDDLRPESFYNDRLAVTCADLEADGVAEISDGALCVFVPGEEAPLIVRKSDGGYGYATTDLAAVRYRLGDLAADRVVYVVDSRQRDHFQKFFAAAGRAGWVGDDHRLDHAAFGTILGQDKRPFKTREGGTVKLADVLDEAVRRADAAIAEKNPDLPPEVRQDVAEAVGIGAVKYADLSNDRIKDYVFDYDRMLSLEGNTAPYLLYSYARIRSIFRKGEVDFDSFRGQTIAVAEPAERALVLHLLRFGETVAAVGETLEPHRLCNYLYDLATRYHRFFEACPVLKADDAPTRDARLALCRLTARTLDTGLGLLGIRVVERM